MAESKASSNDDPNRELRYSISYESDVTKQFVASRTAEVHASFFLPHLRSGMTLLDCGCGPGGITVGLAKKVAPGQAVGIDLAESQVEQASTRAHEQGVENVRFEVGNIYELPFPDNTFDAAFANHVFIHLGQPMDALQEMNRVLKPGGIIGVKEIGFGGWTIYSAKHNNLMKQYSSILVQWIKATSSGDMLIGRRLRELFNKAGFKDVRASASYDSWGTPDGVKWISRIKANLCMEQNFIEGVTRNGIADRETIDRIRDAFIDVGDEEGSLFAMSQVEAVGWK